MFRSRLTLAFLALVVLTLAQGALALWSARVAAYHVEEAEIAGKMLNDYVELSANKQRLKVWYAQHVLAQDAAPAVRDQLLQRMSEGTQRLHSYVEREVRLHKPSIGGGAPFVDPAAHRKTLGAIDANLAAIREGILAARPITESTARAQIWREMLQRFDLLDGADMRPLIAAAIERQRNASLHASEESNRTLSTVDRMVTFTMLIAGVAGAALMAYFRARLRRPIDALMAGVRALEAGRLEHRIGLVSSDEFGVLAQRFDAMAQELQVHERALDERRSALESAVGERTRELSLANRRLHEIDLRRRQFFAEVSHELRTPVTVIRGEAEIALRNGSRTTAQYRETLGRVVDAAVDLGARVDELLRLARTEAEPSPGAFEPVAMGSLAHEVVASMQTQADAQGVRLVVHDGSPRAQAPTFDRVSGDGARLRQLLVLLIDNGVRYSRRGGVVTVRLDTCNPDPATVRLLVEDEGIGIDAADVQHVFERSFRSERARCVRPDGLGLGLTIGRALAQAHGGTLTLRAGVARGCVACIELPRDVPPEGEPRQQAAPDADRPAAVAQELQ